MAKQNQESPQGEAPGGASIASNPNPGDLQTGAATGVTTSAAPGKQEIVQRGPQTSFPMVSPDGGVHPVLGNPAKDPATAKLREDAKRRRLGVTTGNIESVPGSVGAPGIPERRNHRLTRDGMRQVIAEGGSVSIGNETFTHEAHLPDESELAIGDAHALDVADQNLQRQMDTIQKQQERIQQSRDALKQQRATVNELPKK